MIIHLRKYSKVRELLMGDDTTRSLGPRIYKDMGLKGICNLGGSLLAFEGPVD